MLHLFKHGTRSILSNIPHKYTTGQAWEIPGLYSVNGDAADYLFHAHSILSFNVELPPDYPPKNEYLSFWPPRQDHVQEANLLLWNALKLSGCDLVIENNQNQRYEKPKSKMNLREDEKHENENRNRHDNALVFRITVFISRFVFTIERGLSCLFESPSSMGFRILPMESSLASRFDRASVSSSVQSSILFAGFWPICVFYEMGKRRLPPSLRIHREANTARSAFLPVPVLTSAVKIKKRKFEVNQFSLQTWKTWEFLEFLLYNEFF